MLSWICKKGSLILPLKERTTITCLCFFKIFDEIPDDSVVG